DDVWVTGTPGDAAGALVQWREGGERDAALRARLERPAPRVEAGLALVGVAHAAIDISDGLLADLGHVCTAGGAGMEIELEALPVSPMLAAVFDAAQRRTLQCTGGDDYELCFTAAREQREDIATIAEAVGIEMTRIGRVIPGEAVVALERDGRRWDPPRRGFDHFGG